jgi:glycosyltransferase involved in cell wall biosynthesis
MARLDIAEIGELLDSISSGAAPASAKDDGLAMVARESGIGNRYRVWRGRSLRRYLVTVMPLDEAMAVEGAIVMLVAYGADGGREVLWAGESGSSLPGLVIAAGARIEAHVHLLATDAESRAEALADLINGAQGYSSVLTVRAAANQARVGSTTPSRSSSRAVLTT